MASKKLGTIVKEARAKKELTQTALAEMIDGLSASDVGKIERNEKIPEEAVLKAMAKPLGLTQTALLEAAGLKKAASKKTSGTSSSSKKTSGTSSSSKKTSSKKTSSKKEDDLTLTATEKKLIEKYRSASSEEKKLVVKYLNGEITIPKELVSLITASAGSSSSSSGLGSMLTGLLGKLGK